MFSSSICRCSGINSLRTNTLLALPTSPRSAASGQQSSLCRNNRASYSVWASGLTLLAPPIPQTQSVSPPTKKGRVKRKMFRKIRIELLAATHQYDLREKQGNCGPMVKYPQWELLGIEVADIDQIEAFLLGLIMR